MAIHAYAEDYLAGAQRVLGDAVDFAVMTLGLEPDVFGRAFAMSDVSRQFAVGNPKYVAGMNGCELARQVLTETNMPFRDADDIMFVDKGPEYWAGWALAFCQWYTDQSFSEILNAVSMDRMIDMYPAYHEMDVMHFVDRIQGELLVEFPHTRLRMRREACGFSQSELASESEVPLRQIQLFEQKQRDINKTAAETILRLSKALNCKMEDLIER
jgi:DNA-binding Xre family transcriptional regulator